MNEEQLIEFINWLPSVIPEFQNASPDQIVQTLNQMSESDEGQQMLSQLINTFQQAKQSANSQMFKKGGKLAAFVSKYGKGGCVSCKKKEILQGGMVNKFAEKMQEGLISENRLNKLLPKNLAIVNAIPVNQNGGELATMTSAETANNIGLIPKAQGGFITPEVKPSGIRGLFWKAEKYPRLDSGVEGDTPWTGTRSAYYNQDGDLIQSITKKYKNGSEYTTTMEVKNPFTPVADTSFVNTGGDVAWGRKTPKQLRAKKDAEYGNVFNRVMSGLRNNILIEPSKKDK